MLRQLGWPPHGGEMNLAEAKAIVEAAEKSGGVTAVADAVDRLLCTEV